MSRRHIEVKVVTILSDIDPVRTAFLLRRPGLNFIGPIVGKAFHDGLALKK